MRSTYEILKELYSRGYMVRVHPIHEGVELHAKSIFLPDELPKVARCVDGNGKDQEHQCARALAQMLGIELEDA